MDLQSVYEDQVKQGAVSYPLQEREEIEKSARQFVARLVDVCSDASVRERWGVSITLREGGIDAEIDTPFGIAWAAMSIGIDSQSGAIQGFWSIRKRVQDSEGDAASSLVATIRFTQHGQVYLGRENEKSLRAYRDSAGREDRSAYQVMSSILYAIGEHSH